MKIAVSYINSCYDLTQTIKLIDESLADYIHVDLMDGIYVKNKNFDNEITQLFKNTKKPLDIHLMVNNPIQYLNLFKDLKVAAITVHPQTVPNFKKIKQEIREKQIKIGIAINPEENVQQYANLIKEVDQVLIMSVTPGSGGQTFKKEVIPKIAEIKMINPHLRVGMDGGINALNISQISQLDYVVCGSYICQKSDFNLAIQELKDALKK